MIPFFKMHGLGNDFVIMDMRKKLFSLSTAQIKAVSHRKRGVGCDQLIYIEKAKDKTNDCFMRIMNADGNEVENCGNAARCVASYLLKSSDQKTVRLETPSGVIEGGLEGSYYVLLNPPKFEAKDIPLSRPVDAQPMDFQFNQHLHNPYAINLGNPHLVFFVSDIDEIDVEEVGPVLEHNILFPKGINVEFIEVLDHETLRMRVWERGVGVTEACGSGACAAVIAACLKGVFKNKGTVILDGGKLDIEWLDDKKVKMAGDVQFVFEGNLDKKMLDRA